MKSIEGKELKVAKIFCSDHTFRVPPYQRPYAWTSEKANELFDDLFSFYNDAPEEAYFLGSIVLIRNGDTADHDVIDGQQRLITLSILLASLISVFTSESRKNDYIGYLVEPGKESQNIPEHPRLYIRSKDQNFFNKYIQKVNFNELVNLDLAQLPNESQQNILLNAKGLMYLINKKFGGEEDKVVEFAKFIINKCSMVMVTTYNQSTASRVFSVLNTRGLDLLPTDIIKANLCEELNDDKQELFTSEWEELEDSVTRDGMKDLFGHLRMIYARAKAKKGLIEEFHTHIRPKIQDPMRFINDVLSSYVNAYDIIKECSFVSIDSAKEINVLFRWLNQIENTDWMPVALMFLTQKKNDSSYVLWFMQKLERLSAYIYLSSKDINQRIERYKEILTEMDTYHSIDKPLSSIELTSDEKEEFASLINNDIYRNGGKGLPIRKCGYLILRLDSFMSDQAAEYKRSMLTIEHILPQKVTPGSDWETKWPDKEYRERWLHKLANLVPLTIKRNSSASNYDFETKKKKYFRGTDSVTTYSTTQQVIMLDRKSTRLNSSH